METLKYQAIVIGAGQGGVPLAISYAENNHKVALIEREHVGGSCVNYGCTPSKTMIASAKVAYLTRRSPDFGVNSGETKVDMVAVRKRKREMVERFRMSNLKRLEDAGVDLIRGKASFLDPVTIQVTLNEGGKRNLSAENVFIDTGARPRIPDLEGLQTVPFLDSTSIMELDELPEKLLILGGGYIGVEFSQMFARFGSNVTIIEMGEQLLRREDEDIAQEVASLLREDGVEVLLQYKPLRIQRTETNRIQLQVQDRSSGKELVITGTHLLVAAGRVPNMEDLRLDRTGIEQDDRGHIVVNNRLETNVDHIYALGDVKGGPAFTHISYDDYRILRNNLLDGGNASIEDRFVPYTVFIDPELGRIGLSEKQAKDVGKQVRVAKMPMDYVSRALEMGQSRGLMKVLVEMNSDQIVGAAILGIQGGEMMAMIQIAMMAGLPFTALREGIFTHPTLAESLNSVFTNFHQ